MKYKCSKGHVFLLPMIVHATQEGSDQVWIEYKACPECAFEYNYKIEEFVEPLPVPIQEAISNVYIHDLTSGAQTALDALLAQGYRIVNRFSKQYHLEKPAEAKAKDQPLNTVEVERALGINTNSAIAEAV